MANAFILLALVAAAAAVHKHVGVGKSVAVSHGKFVPYYKDIEIGYGMLKPTFKERIGLSFGHRIGFRIAKGAGAGIKKGISKLKRRRLLKHLSTMAMYPGGIGIGHELMG